VRSPVDQQGFSLVEMLVSLVLILGVTATILAVVIPAQSALQTEPERADMQQRLRVSINTLTNDLLMAGNGSFIGANAGPLMYFFAPVLPLRQGLRQPDPVGTFKTDTITLLYVPLSSSQATIAQPMPAQSGNVTVSPDPGCPIGDPVCGFSIGMDVLIYDDLGFSDLFSVTSVTAPTLQLQHNFRDASRTYNSGSKLVQITSRTYYLKSDNATKTYQLMRYEGGSGNDVPVVDHVVALRFEYYGDPQPPSLLRPLSEPKGPWTTYGPKPPEPNVQPTAFPAGENCLFTRDRRRDDWSAARVPWGSVPLVSLDHSQLTDGPWCPDASDPNRFDADLLRIRKIAVTLRVESAVDALRGPSSFLFSHSGFSKAGTRFLPDQEIRFDVSPRNLNLGR
jgi:prepilin-type N-terminal cleavage/methylation domain-containing protein